MRRIALALVGLASLCWSASAADMPVKARPASIFAPSFTWTGFYIGAHIGGAWAEKDIALTGVAGLGGHTADGVIGGFQFGYNWQANQWVWGFEAQFSWADLKGSHVDQFLSQQNTKIDFLGSASLRFGHAWDRHLAFAKVGVAWVNDDYVDIDTTTGLVFGTASETRVGWMIGVGWEYAFAPNWSAKVEYNYMDFGSETLTFTPGSAPAPFQHDIEQVIHLVKVGINYRFSWGMR